MEYTPVPLLNAAEQFAKLPGIGMKTAQRLAYHILSIPEESAVEFAEGIIAARKSVQFCNQCQNFTEKTETPEGAKQACLCNHLHLSLQSGSDSVLRRMNRKYDTEMYAKIAAQFRDCALTTDIIVGFPGESESEFSQTLSFVEKMRFAKIHVFPFSKREGTAAALMPGQISKAVKSERAERLGRLADSLRQAHFESLIGTVQEVLIEKNNMGHTKCYTPVKVNGSDNSIVKIKIERENLFC